MRILWKCDECELQKVFDFKSEYAVTYIEKNIRCECSRCRNEMRFAGEIITPDGTCQTCHWWRPNDVRYAPHHPVIQEGACKKNAPIMGTSYGHPDPIPLFSETDSITECGDYLFINGNEEKVREIEEEIEEEIGPRSAEINYEESTSTTSTTTTEFPEED